MDITFVIQPQPIE